MDLNTERKNFPFPILLWIVSSSILNNFLSPRGFVQCAFLGSFWPLILHSCIHLYNAQHCSFIGQISVVLDNIVYDTGTVTNFSFLFFKQSVAPATVILQNMQGPFWTSPDWISYWKSNSHLNNEIELFPLITWSLRSTSAEQQIAPCCTFMAALWNLKMTRTALDIVWIPSRFLSALLQILATHQHHLTALPPE